MCECVKVPCTAYGGDVWNVAFYTALKREMRAKHMGAKSPDFASLL